MTNDNINPYLVVLSLFTRRSSVIFLDPITHCGWFLVLDDRILFKVVIDWL